MPKSKSMDLPVKLPINFTKGDALPVVTLPDVVLLFRPESRPGCEFHVCLNEHGELRVIESGRNNLTVKPCSENSILIVSAWPGRGFDKPAKADPFDPNGFYYLPPLQLVKAFTFDYTEMDAKGLRATAPRIPISELQAQESTWLRLTRVGVGGSTLVFRGGDDRVLGYAYLMSAEKLRKKADPELFAQLTFDPA